MIAFLVSQLSSFEEAFSDFSLNQRSEVPFGVWKLGVSNHIVLETGIGKVNSAAAATYLCTRYPEVASIFNIDFVGGLHSGMKIGQTYKIDYAQFFDVDMTAFGYKQGQIAGFPDNFYDILNPDVPADIQTARCITGDSFVTSTQTAVELKDKYNADVLDLEAAALAHTFALFGKSDLFNCLKIVTDRADAALNSNEYAPQQEMWKAAKEVITRILHSEKI